jgi:hypothetical protein
MTTSRRVGGGVEHATIAEATMSVAKRTRLMREGESA